MTVTRRTSPISIYAPAETKALLADEARKYHMDLSSYCLRLISRGIAVEELERATDNLRATLAEHTNQSLPKALLETVFAIRYIVESQAKGAIRSPATLGFDANTYASREIAKLNAETGGKNEY